MLLHCTMLRYEERFLHLEFSTKRFGSAFFVYPTVALTWCIFTRRKKNKIEFEKQGGKLLLEKYNEYIFLSIKIKVNYKERIR